MEPLQLRDIESRWFSPIQMLELDSCSRCQECVRVCPVVVAGFPDGAMERIAEWQRLSTHPTGLFKNRNKKIDFSLLLSRISSTLARCTSCGICAIVCESAILTTPLWESMRGACMEMGFKEPLAEKTGNAILSKKNPYDGELERRTSWIPPSAQIARSTSIGFFPGCTIAYRQPELGRAALRILELANVPFCMLGNEEYCCGSYLFRTGFEKEYTDTIRKMITDFESRGVKTLLVSCAGCLKTITLDWPRVYGKPIPFQAISFSLFIRDLVRDKRITLKEGKNIRVAYHDPCHSGRHLMHHLGNDQVFEAPRDVLKAIPGVSIFECAENREFQSCCGAGGGVKAEDPPLAHEIGKRKIKQVHELDVDILATTCPFCERNFKDVCKERIFPLEVMDVIELVDRAMEKG